MIQNSSNWIKSGLSVVNPPVSIASTEVGHNATLNAGGLYASTQAWEGLPFGGGWCEKAVEELSGVCGEMFEFLFVVTSGSGVCFLLNILTRNHRLAFNNLK